MRMTRRFIAETIDGLNLSKPVRYERYYINDNLRIQRKGDFLEKEILDESNTIIEKVKMSLDEFNILKSNAYSKIIRDSYLYLNDRRVSIKKYLEEYEGLIRVELTFTSIEEQNNYIPEPWMKKEITTSPLAFDKDLSKLNKQEFLIELKKNK